MRIGENDFNVSSSTSLVNSNSSDEMVDNDNESLRDRMCELEKKVYEQNDEIMCLRSTLADALRRINNIEATKGVPSTERQKDVISLKIRTPDVRDGKRPATYIPSRHTPSTNGRTNRKGPQYQSTSSLYSDGHSSLSASPAPSPSPTNATVVPSNRHLAASPQARPQSTPLGKRWASTSDFSSPNGLTHAFGTSINNSHTPLANSRKANGGSLHNLSTLRGPHPFPTSGRAWREIQYNSEEGMIKMYLRGRPLNMHVPSAMKDSFKPQGPSSPPNAKLKLEWVYGYRGKDCRNNVQQLPTGEIVYFIASVVVLYDVVGQTQRHYLAHTDDIKCLAVHPNKMTIATGQTAGHDRKDTRSWRLNPPSDPYSIEAEEWPHIRVWDSVSLQTLHVIGISEIERSVSCLAFSQTDGGGLLVAVDDAPDHNLSIWDWSKGDRGLKLIETKCAADQVLSVDFSPVDRNTIIVTGRNQISFWLYDNGMLAKKLGIFEHRERPKYVTSLSFTDSGHAISGDSNGNLLIWQRGGNRVERSAKNAHDGSVLTIYVQKDGTIISGGKDGKIIEWTRDLKPTGRIIKLSDNFGSPRVVTSGKGSQLVIGTTRNCLLGGTFALPLQPIMQGHTDDLWGLAAHPSQNQFITAGFDKNCYMWDSMSKTIIWQKDIGESLLSASFSPSGNIVVIGTTNGTWRVLHVATRELRSTHQDGTEPIQVLKFSPNGRSLAVGSRDGNIYLYQVSEDLRKFSRVGRCLGHSSAVVHIDWSNDNQILRSNSGDYDIIYWNSVLCRPVAQPSELRDVEWASQNCTLSFSTIGSWFEDCDVNSCAKANNIPLLVTGDDMGKLRLFNHPACYPKAKFVEAVGHSSHLSCVRFLHNDARLISTGAKDSAIMQWIVSGSTSFSFR